MLKVIANLTAGLLGIILWLDCGARSPTLDPSPVLTGVYTNALRSGTDSGRIEIFLLQGPNGYLAMLQCWAPDPGVPEIIEVEVAYPTVTFNVSEGSLTYCAPGSYRGNLEVNRDTVGGMRIVGPSDKRERFLLRARSFWQ